MLWHSEFQYSSQAFIRVCVGCVQLFSVKTIAEGKQRRELLYLQFCAYVDDTPKYHIQTEPENGKETRQESV